MESNSEKSVLEKIKNLSFMEKDLRILLREKELIVWESFWYYLGVICFTGIAGFIIAAFSLFLDHVFNFNALREFLFTESGNFLSFTLPMSIIIGCLITLVVFINDHKNKNNHMEFLENINQKYGLNIKKDKNYFDKLEKVYFTKRKEFLDDREFLVIALKGLERNNKDFLGFHELIMDLSNSISSEEEISSKASKKLAAFEAGEKTKLRILEN